MRILILGGTTEASALAKLIANDQRFAPTLSLAGRTSSPAIPVIPYRIGGFGGPDGLASWLKAEGVAAMIDATHPFAAHISANAVQAAEIAAIPMLSLIRPAWTPQPGDCWISTPTPEEAALALGSAPRTVFLTVGRLELTRFAAAPQHHYLARVIDSPGDIPLPPQISFIQDRGPFDAEAEARLLTERRIQVIVSKNSGGSATYGKITAANRLGLPVVMIERPHKPALQAVHGAPKAMQWLERLFNDHGASRSERGV
jgi:precorrin-6A/cobalt-precorrin-6A reductase